MQELAEIVAAKLQKFYVGSPLQKSRPISPNETLPPSMPELHQELTPNNLHKEKSSETLKDQARSSGGMTQSVKLTESLLDIFAEKKIEYFKKFTIRVTKIF
jgi:hypothetical protein